MNFKKIIGALIISSFFLLLAGCETENKTRIIKLGHGLDITHPVHKAMMFMAERVKEKSDGKMQIDIYPNQQLGSERECLELLQIGSLGMTKVSTGVMENFAPELKVFGLPFLFRDREHRFKVLEGEIGQKLLNSSIDKRLKGLTFYDAGSRSFYSKTPINGPEDLKGLKLRVMESQTAIQMVRLLGGSPTPIASGELYTALQQGIVDGAENNPPTFYLTRDYEVCKYLILDEHTSIPDELVIGMPVWNQLTAQEKKWLKQAAMESLEYEKKIWREAELHALEEVKKAGVKVTKAKKDEFRKLVKPMYDEFSLDPVLREIIENIQKEK